MAIHPSTWLYDPAGVMAVQPGRVGIVGLGLIGGSLGLDLQAQGWTKTGVRHIIFCGESDYDISSIQFLARGPNLRERTGPNAK